MKKIATRVLSLLMVCTMLVGLVACGSKDEKMIVGKWKTTINIFELGQEMIDEDSEWAEYLDLDEFDVTMYCEFKNDGTYATYADEDELKEDVADIKDGFVQGFRAYFEAMIEEAGEDMTVDELLAQADMGTLEEIVDQLLGDMFVEANVEAFASEGQYMLKDGKLYMSEDVNVEPEEKDGEPYELSDDELVIHAPEGKDDTGFPLEFKRVK